MSVRTMPLSASSRRLAVAAASLALAAALGGCASADDDTAATDPAPSSAPTTEPDSDPEPTSSPSDAPSEEPTEEPTPEPTPEPTGPTLAVTVAGSDVGPNAEELTVEVGEPLTITFVSDRPGELHVHSKPEQYVQFEAGRSEQEIVIETPGSVEIEDHDTGAVVALVEAR